VSPSRSKSRDYVGLACTFHDPGLAIVNAAGQLIFAEATERHLQSKRAFNCSADSFPYVNSVVHNYCDPHADVVVAKTWTSGAIRNQSLIGLGTHILSWLLPANHFLHPALDSARWLCAAMQMSGPTGENLRRAYNREGLPWQRVGDPQQSAVLKRKRRVSVIGFDHHLTHAAAGCYTSPFPDAVCAVVDGYGENGSTAFFEYRD
jgi:carbamoyltransferase